MPTSWLRTQSPSPLSSVCLRITRGSQRFILNSFPAFWPEIYRKEYHRHICHDFSCKNTTFKYSDSPWWTIYWQNESVAAQRFPTAALSDIFILICSPKLLRSLWRMIPSIIAPLHLGIIPSSFVKTIVSPLTKSTCSVTLYLFLFSFDEASTVKEGRSILVIASWCVTEALPLRRLHPTSIISAWDYKRLYLSPSSYCLRKNDILFEISADFRISFRVIFEVDKSWPINIHLIAYISSHLLKFTPRCFMILHLSLTCTKIVLKNCHFHLLNDSISPDGCPITVSLSFS